MSDGEKLLEPLTFLFCEGSSAFICVYLRLNEGFR